VHASGFFGNGIADLGLGDDPASSLLRGHGRSGATQNAGIKSSTPDGGLWPKPEGWESMSFGDTRRHFNCKAWAHDQTKPLPTLEDWKYFQHKYQINVDKDATFDDPVPPTMGYTLGEGGPPPYDAKHTADGKGRGLFASRDIKKGELVHDGGRSDFVYPDAMAWRRFIFSLPRNKACDQADWTWTQRLEENGSLRILGAMNISILLNSSRNKPNILPKSDSSSKFYALRDIAKDEQLLMNYRVYETNWGKVGLGKKQVSPSGT